MLRETKTFGPTKQVKELPVCVTEKAFFANPDWLKVGFDLLKSYVCYPRDCLVPRLKSDGELGRSIAGYGDALVATAGILSKIGLPPVVQDCWTEHSERAALPTRLSVLETPLAHKDILGRCGNPMGPIPMPGRMEGE